MRSFSPRAVATIAFLWKSALMLNIYNHSCAKSANLAKFGPADAEIIDLKGIVKIRKEKETAAERIPPCCCCTTAGRAKLHATPLR